MHPCRVTTQEAESIRRCGMAAHALTGSHDGITAASAVAMLAGSLGAQSMHSVRGGHAGGWEAGPCFAVHVRSCVQLPASSQYLHPCCRGIASTALPFTPPTALPPHCPLPAGILVESAVQSPCWRQLIRLCWVAWCPPQPSKCKRNRQPRQL